MVSTYGPRFGLDRKMGLRVAGGFGAGMARMGETCGAVTGALMVIGLEHGKTRADDDEAREKAYELVKEFVTQFRSRNKSIVCKELLGHDISTPEGMLAIRQKNLFTTLCPRFVRDAAEILEHMPGHL